MIISQRTAPSSLRKIDMACKSWQQIPTDYFVYGSVYVSMILSQLGFCKNPEGWDRMGSGREVQQGIDIRIPMADSC